MAKDSSPLLTRSFLFWGAVSVVSFLILWFLWKTLIPFFTGFFMAYVLSPLVQKFEGWGIKRWVSSLIFMLSFFALIFGFFLILIPLTQNQLRPFFLSLPTYGEKLFAHGKPLWSLAQSYTGAETSAEIKTFLSGSFRNIFDWGVNLLMNLLASGIVIANFLSFLIFAPLMTFYFLKDWHKILGHVLWLVPPVFHKKLKAFLGEVDSALGNYARGQLLVCSFLAIYYTIGLELVGLKFAPFIGVMTGFLIFIPYLGFLVGLLFSVGICLLISPSWPFILGVLGVYGIGQGLEGLLLTPRLVGGKTGLHPLWILFALFSSGALFGLVGVVFCLPIAAVLRVLASWGLRAYRESVYYKGCNA